MSLGEVISDANSVVGFGLMLISAGSGLGYWIHRRMKGVATEVSETVIVAVREIDARVKDLEKDVPNLAKGLSELKGQTDNLDGRLRDAEKSIVALPSKDDFHGLTLGMSRVEGNIGKMDERLKPIAATAERLQEFLIAQGATK